MVAAEADVCNRLVGAHGGALSTGAVMQSAHEQPPTEIDACVRPLRRSDNGSTPVQSSAGLRRSSATLPESRESLNLRFGLHPDRRGAVCSAYSEVYHQFAPPKKAAAQKERRVAPPAAEPSRASGRLRRGSAQPEGSCVPVDSSDATGLSNLAGAAAT